LQGQKRGGSGCLIIGEKGTLYSTSDYGDDRTLLPLDNFKGYKPLAPILPRAPGNSHHREWTEACKGAKQQPMSNFDYAAAPTEMVLLGNVAMRAGKKIVWDHQKMQAVGLKSADQYIRREYRKGWTL